MRRALFGPILLLATMLLLFTAAPVSAFPLTNCVLKIESIGPDGAPIDTAESGADDATQDDPFLVDWDGSVAYEGAAEISMVDNTWSILVFNLPTPLMGGDDNPQDNRTGSGTVGVSENAPFRFTGLYYVSGSLTGSGGTCAGSGWFKLTGDPISTIPFWVALGLLVVGLGLLARGVRGHAISAVVGGILAGLGVTTLLVIFSTLPLGSITVPLMLLLGVVIGILVALVGRRGKGDDAPTPPAEPTAPAGTPPAPEPPTPPIEDVPA